MSFFFFSCSLEGKNIKSKIDKGRKLKIEITPVNCRFSDPRDYHSYTIYKKDSAYQFYYSGYYSIYTKKITNEDVQKIIYYFENLKVASEEKSKKMLWIEPRIIIKMKIGLRSVTFKSEFSTDTLLLNRLFIK